MFRVGDWVYLNVPRSYMKGALGYVDEVDDRGFGYMVEFLRDKQGRRMKKRVHCFRDELALASEEVTKEDYESIIDLALATRDFGWCRELHSKMREEKKV
ncbi:hypothetical protein P9850_01870 [Anoxybacillus rupiensis]|uniref:IDEAL domain-containing protein n=1 Tax=Anoxybacteroides rupiense TaxID=311460 RepID=A0ABD5IQQ5_9BACL|nr:hypothetical protein [Anoxybacillus rupiensis]